MGRFKKGDIVVNLWTEKKSPVHKGVYIGNGTVMFPYKFHRSDFGMDRLENDTEHFVKVGHCPVEDLFRKMLEHYTDNKEI